MKIFEKLGVTDNTDDLIDSIIRDISYICYPRITEYNVKEYLGNRNFIFNKSKNVINIKFKIDAKHNTCFTWLSNSSSINLNIINCKDYNEYNELKYVYGNSSIFKKAHNKIKGIITLSIFNVTTEFGGWGTYINNELMDDKNLKSIIQHELNHIHKNINYKNTDENYNDYYGRLMIKIHENGIVGTFAYMLYVTCIQDERNAHIEQFYREVQNKDPYSSKIYNKIISFYNEIEFLKRRKNLSNLVNSIYINFAHICKNMFGIKYKDKEDFIEKFIKLLEDNVNKTRKLMHRTLSLYESYDDIVEYYPNRYRRY